MGLKAHMMLLGFRFHIIKKMTAHQCCFLAMLAGWFTTLVQTEKSQQRLDGLP